MRSSSRAALFRCSVFRLRLINENPSISVTTIRLNAKTDQSPVTIWFMIPTSRQSQSPLLTQILYRTLTSTKISHPFLSESRLCCKLHKQVNQADFQSLNEKSAMATFSADNSPNKNMQGTSHRAGFYGTTA